MHPKDDPRNIENGYAIPKENYCDQPYTVVRSDGAIVVCLTTGTGEEGVPGQHVISSISRDKGKTWSNPVDIEPGGGPEASWVMPYLTGYGRIYAFYVYNKDNLRRIPYHTPAGFTTRVDTLGGMMYKYSDDGGESWSEERYEIPIRNFDIDNENPYGGKVQYFWGVGKPIRHKNALYLGYAKVGIFGEGFMEKDEGAFLKCPNIETEKDPAKLLWETLPEGTVGLRAPEGKVADEHNLVSLNCGDLFCTFRTVTGHNCQGYSRDDGKTWEVKYAEKSPDGRLFKHPRAANFVHKYANGKYTLWFHNHGRSYLDDPSEGYFGRNPAFLSGGVEKDGVIHWSEPEIVLYSRNADDRISYPDFFELDGEYYVTETQKTVARLHRMDRKALERMWNHLENEAFTEEGLLWDTVPGEAALPLPHWISCKEGHGFSLQLILQAENARPGILLDGRNGRNEGILLLYTDRSTVKLILTDGQRENAWESDPLTEAVSHVTVTVDGGADVITFVQDGTFADGGDGRDYGFGRIDPSLGRVDGAKVLRYGKSASALRRIRFYNRALLTNEAVGNYRHDKKAGLLD